MMKELVRPSNGKWRLLTRKRRHAICARQKLSFADGQIGWLPQPPLLFSLVGVMWCVCGDGRAEYYIKCACTNRSEKSRVCGVTLSVKPKFYWFGLQVHRFGPKCVSLCDLVLLVSSIIFCAKRGQFCTEAKYWRFNASLVTPHARNLYQFKKACPCFFVLDLERCKVKCVWK